MPRSEWFRNGRGEETYGVAGEIYGFQHRRLRGIMKQEVACRYRDWDELVSNVSVSIYS